MTISADLPLITVEVIDGTVERYMRCNKPALMVAVPAETKKKLGFEVEHMSKRKMKCLVPARVSTVGGRKTGEERLVQLA